MLKSNGYFWLEFTEKRLLYPIDEVILRFR